MQIKKPAIDLSNTDVLKDFNASAPKIFVPMPKFEYSGPSDFHNVARTPPYNLVPDLQQKEGHNAHMPAKHPAFTVVLNFLVPKLFGEMSVLDWGWHKEVLRRSRIREEAHHIVRRIETEDMLRELHEIQADKQLAFLHAAWNKRAETATDRQKERLAIGREEAREFVQDMNHTRLAIRDERAVKEFLRQYFKVFSPTNLARQERIHRSQTEPTLAQARIAKDLEITPYEVLLDVAQKRLPLLKKTELHEAFRDMAQYLNQVKLSTNNVVEFKRQLTQMFTANFIMRSGAGVLAKEHEKQVLYELKETRNFHVEKSIESRSNAKEHLIGYLNHLHNERKLFGDLLDHLKFERKVDEVYHEKFALQQKAKAKERIYLPLIIEGETGLVQIYSQEVTTQYRIINQWVNHVQNIMQHRDVALVENVLKQQEHNKDQMTALSAFVTKDAERLHRMRDAMNMQDYFRKYDLHETLAAIFARTQDTKIMMAPTTNEILDKKALSQQLYQAISPAEKAATFKRIA